MEKLSIKQISILDRLYKDINSSTCFTSLEPLLREAKRVDKSITRDAVKKYLSTQNTYTLHRRAVRKYKRMRTLAAGLHTEWQADLSIFDRLSSQNKGFKYLLVCIDTLSRMIFVEPVKSKHSEKMIDAFKRLFSRIKIVPWKLLTDQGLEFTAKEVKKYFKSIDMEHFSMFTSPQWHAGMAERANRSIKERLYRYFTEKRTLKWVDVIQDIVNAINNSFNSSIGMRPIDVTYKNAEGLRLKLKEQAREEVAPNRWKHTDFSVGDKVRIEKYKHVFQKGYLPNFTDEIFVIKQVRLVPHQRPTYRLSDKKGELIRGWFYANDLCLVRERKKEDVLYDIEKVLKKRNFDGENQYFVKWKGYGTRFNSWIPASSVNWR
uniref:Uncharacterized protein n=1 Tax=Meloidogyne enterolobii TaxID=390850 RepID=A0A6V7V8G8_MELEN|nr:unnamed protein product [Meloidogyne enterolobii]CAD2180561.1 unnamed protein product [Meloidogyne enterolobii]